MALVQWADSRHQTVSVDWFIVRTPEDAEELAAIVEDREVVEIHRDERMAIAERLGACRERLAICGLGAAEVVLLAQDLADAALRERERATRVAGRVGEHGLGATVQRQRVAIA